MQLIFVFFDKCEKISWDSNDIKIIYIYIIQKLYIYIYTRENGDTPRLHLGSFRSLHFVNFHAVPEFAC